MARLSPAVLSLALAALAACGDTPGVSAPAARPAAAPARAALGAAPSADGVVAGRYIVRFRPGRGSASRAAHLVSAGDGRLRHTYAHVFQGFAAELSEAAVRVLSQHPDVELVAPDPVISTTATQTGATWGLDRLDQTALPLSTTYAYANDGSGVVVYILDTGIYTAHADFGGRAVPGYDAITPGGSASDCHGHGTHVAGTVGGTTWGVAKGVRLVAVRVLDCSGNGSGSGLLAGLDYVAQQKAASPATPMAMNMSLSGAAAQLLDDAVRNVIDRGVAAVVAAGNASSDACTASPARLPDAITVGATTSRDELASFSNHGVCVDLEAPGVGITSAAHTSPTGSRAMSGTSMAAPHVAGVAALYLQANPSATPAQVAAALTGNAISAVKLLPSGTVNKLLNVRFLVPGLPVEPTIALSPRTPALVIGGTSALAATIANPVPGVTVSWVTRNTAVATVAASGATSATATATGAGATYIVASYVAGLVTVRDSARITVATPTIAVSPRTPSVVVGAKAALSAAVGNAGVSGSISWLSRNTAVATVAAAGAGSASATGVAAGSAYVVASYVSGKTTVRDSALVTVTAPAPTATSGALLSATGWGCLDVNGQKPVSGAAVVRACATGLASQDWTRPATGTRGPVRVFGTMCLTAMGGGTLNYPVNVTPCVEGNAGQTWTPTAAGELRTGTGYCATASRSSAGATALVHSRVCTGDASQRWSW